MKAAADMGTCCRFAQLGVTTTLVGAASLFVGCGAAQSRKTAGHQSRKTAGHSCRRSAAGFTTRAPAHGLLSHLAVLRRAQTAPDRPTGDLTFFLNSRSSPFGEVSINYVRFLGRGP